MPIKHSPAVCEWLGRHSHYVDLYRQKALLVMEDGAAYLLGRLRAGFRLDTVVCYVVAVALLANVLRRSFGPSPDRSGGLVPKRPLRNGGVATAPTPALRQPDPRWLAEDRRQGIRIKKKRPPLTFPPATPPTPPPSVFAPPTTPLKRCRSVSRTYAFEIFEDPHF